MSNSTKEMDSLIELEGELWREFLRRQLDEMRAIGFKEGEPFRTGWDSAIEEISARMRVDGARCLN